jgi:CheY-like chemotaxis protein
MTTTVSRADILKAKILIVDDQPTNVELLEQLLAVTGYSDLHKTYAPQEVVCLHQKHQYDLILLDLKMPEMDGFEVIEALKQQCLDNYLPVIVLTADPTQKLRALNAGAKDFLSKPFCLVEVKTRIYNMLEIRLLYKLLAKNNQLLAQTIQAQTLEQDASKSSRNSMTKPLAH